MDLATCYASEVAIWGWYHDTDGVPMQGNDTNVMTSNVGECLKGPETSIDDLL
jgi:hypothetical protein